MRRDPIHDADAILHGATDSELRAIQATLRQEQYRRDPVLWMNERLGAFAWSKQQEIALSVLDHRHTAVRACHDSGKSWTGAQIACWWIDTHPLGEAFVVTSAPTGSGPADDGGLFSAGSGGESDIDSAAGQTCHSRAPFLQA